MDRCHCCLMPFSLMSRQTNSIQTRKFNIYVFTRPPRMDRISDMFHQTTQDGQDLRYVSSDHPGWTQSQIFFHQATQRGHGLRYVFTRPSSLDEVSDTFSPEHPGCTRSQICFYQTIQGGRGLRYVFNRPIQGRRSLNNI